MWEQLPNIILCLAIWTVAWGSFFFFLYNKGVSYANNFLLTTIYFLSVAAVTFFVFKDHVFRAVENVAALPLLILSLFLLIHVLLYTYVPRFIRRPAEYFKKYPNRQYLDVDKRMIISKSADILAQQMFIVLLILFLQDAGLPLKQTTAAFGVMFGLLHIPLIASERNAWPSYFFAFAVILFSFIFPAIIINVRYGFVYTYIIHWLFYIFMAVGFWVWYANNPRPEHADG